jgi:hypothetical protein
LFVYEVIERVIGREVIVNQLVLGKTLFILFIVTVYVPRVKLVCDSGVVYEIPPVICNGNDDVT